MAITAELSTLFQAIYFSMCGISKKTYFVASRIPQYQRLAHMAEAAHIAQTGCCVVHGDARFIIFIIDLQKDADDIIISKNGKVCSIDKHAL